MPDPVVSHTDGVDPEHEALLVDSVGLALVAVLDLGVVLRSDGGLARPGASAVIHGGPTVAAQALAFARLSLFVRPALVNAAAGVVVVPRGRPVSVMGFTVRNGKIIAIDVLADPARHERPELVAESTMGHNRRRGACGGHRV